MACGAETEMRRGLRALVSALLLLVGLLGGVAFGEEDPNDPDRVHLDADRVVYDEAGSVATAEGDVRVRNRDLRLYAPYVEYHVEGQKVVAQATPEGQVSLLVGGKQLYGERAEYDLVNRSGVLKNASGRVDAFYLRGRDLEILPLDQARKLGWNTPRQLSGEGAEEQVARWTGVSVTTCDQRRPHYRLESRQVTVVPGKRVIVKSPKVYIGEHLLFAYPFDYVVDVDARRRRSPLLPLVGYDQKKGAGLGLSGPIDWGSGGVDLSVTAWSEIDPEVQVEFHQSLGTSSEVFAALNRLYDKDDEDLVWRPQWGIRSELQGFGAKLLWSQREMVSVERRAGETVRYVVWRDPELTLTGPWRRDLPTAGWWRPLFSAGYYEDATAAPGETTRRLGLGVEIYSEPSPWGVFRPFLHLTGWGYDYDDEAGDRQGILDAEVGFRYSFGSFDLMSAYVRRWTSGESPMAFDSPDDREDLYQEVGFTFLRPTKDTSWRLVLRGAYDLLEDEFGEFVARLIYDQHCVLWELVYRDDLEGDDDWVGLRFSIKAFPDSVLQFGGETLYQPGQRPADLPKEALAGMGAGGGN